MATHPMDISASIAKAMDAVEAGSSFAEKKDRVRMRTLMNGIFWLKNDLITSAEADFVKSLMKKMGENNFLYFLNSGMLQTIKNRSRSNAVDEWILLKKMGPPIARLFSNEPLNKAGFVLSMAMSHDHPFDFELRITPKRLENRQDLFFAKLNFSLYLNANQKPRAVLGNFQVKHPEAFPELQKATQNQTLEVVQKLFLKAFGRKNVFATSPKKHHAYMNPTHENVFALASIAKRKSDFSEAEPKFSSEEIEALFYLNRHFNRRRDIVESRGREKIAPEVIPHHTDRQRQILLAYRDLKRRIGRIQGATALMHSKATAKNFEPSKKRSYWRARRQ